MRENHRKTSVWCCHAIPLRFCHDKFEWGHVVDKCCSMLFLYSDMFDSLRTADPGVQLRTEAQIETRAVGDSAFQL